MIAAVFMLSAAASGARPDDWVAQAEAALARRDGIAAEVAANRAVEAGVAKADVAALAGEAELLQGDLVAARRWLAPGDFGARSRQRGFHTLARLEMIEGNLDAAAAAFDRALQFGSGSGAMWADIGRLRYRLGQHHQALAAAIKAVEIGPRDPRALEFRGQLVRDASGPLAALPWFERGLAVSPDDFGLLGEYAATLGEAGRHRDMLAVARRMVEIDPRDPRAYFLQAVLAARAGRDDLARRLMYRTNGAYDNLPAGELLLGVLELRDGDPTLAVDRLDGLSRSQPDNAAATLLLGRALLASGDAREVVARLAPAADSPSASPYLLTLVGRAYEQTGDRSAAARYLDRAAEAHRVGLAVLPPRDSEGSRDDVARLRELVGQGRGAEARALTASLRRRYPGSIDVEVLSGDTALLLGGAQEALGYYQRAAAIRRDLALVERIGMAHRLSGRPEAALAVATEFAEQNPRSPGVATLLSRMAADRATQRRAALARR